MKRGTKITYTYAGGKVVSGSIVRKDEAMPDWYICRLTDESGSYTVCCHQDQIRNIGNH